VGELAHRRHLRTTADSTVDPRIRLGTSAATVVVTTTTPRLFTLAAADVAGVYVVQVIDRTATVLVHGSVPARAHRVRMIATRYWEERMFAHALTSL
jgi:hypothetical protein